MQQQGNDVPHLVCVQEHCVHPQKVVVMSKMAREVGLDVNMGPACVVNGHSSAGVGAVAVARACGAASAQNHPVCRFCPGGKGPYFDSAWRLG
eukprot:10911606-Alexandrium_andersonii.AAC.1